MSDLILDEINKIRQEVLIAQDLSDDILFGIVCHKYFYNKGRYDKSDFRSSFVDGTRDGGIDSIAIVEDDTDGKKLILMQSKNHQNIHSKDEIVAAFNKMAETVSNFQNNNYAIYNENLIRIFLEKYQDAYEDNNFSIHLTIFINCEISEEKKEYIRDHIERNENLNDFIINIYYKNVIESEIKKWVAPVQWVDHGKVKIYKDHGTLQYGERGLLVSIKSNSLRELYFRYKNMGLFEQNFRYYVQNKKIDDNITSSIKKTKDDFWFLNNGLIIGCENFMLDGDTVKLEIFSIINGCQTTSMIGKYSGKDQNEDFPIICKIVKPSKTKKAEDFVSEIAEASNSQKKISDRDLKSNAPEQKYLVRLLKTGEPKIYLDIKRGSKGLNKKMNLEKWQKVKNDKLGQYILSFFLQQPGTARSSKKKIFGDNTVYHKVFKRTHDKNAIIDLLKLSVYYDEMIKEHDFDNDTINVGKNGKLFVLALLGMTLKFKRGLLGDKVENLSTKLKNDNLNGQLLRDDRPDESENIIKDLYVKYINIIHTNLMKKKLEQLVIF